MSKINRHGEHQIVYELDDGRSGSFRAHPEIVDIIDIAFSGIEFQENTHPGMLATEKYLKEIMRNGGKLAVVMLVDDITREIVQTEECPRCKKQVPLGTVEIRHSAQVYAGRFCEDCAIRGYRDHCGVDGTPQLSESELDEPLEPEEGIGFDL